MNVIEQMTNKELEQLIYEATHEMTDKKRREQLLMERKRRNLDE